MEVIGEDGSLDLSELRQIKQVYQGFTYCRDHDVIVAKITPCFENGKGALALGLRNGIGFGTTELHVMRPKKQVDERFLFYITRSSWFRSAGERMMFGAGGQKRVPEDFIKDFVLPLPGKDQQRRIAVWLDGKLGRLDELVRKKERQLALLAEKRQALISHAVTRGLNPNAPTKPSGLPWLGEIPSHWQIMRVKYLTTKIGSGKTPLGGSQVYTTEGVMFLRSQNIYDAGLRLDDVVFITEAMDEELATSRVQSDDILLNITGASIGRSCIYPVGMPRANVNQHVCILRIHRAFSPNYLAFALQSQFTKHQIFAGENGTSREGLNFEQVGNLVVTGPFQDAAEQAAITNWLKGALHKLDIAHEKLTLQITKLREYRQALITAAVTGEIKVPEAAA
jgi:type I restriction enzyme S subunit